MFQIRAGQDNDKGQILELIKEVYGTEEAQRAERRWQWQWHEDPRLDGTGYKGVVAEWDGRVIGTLSSIPCGLYIEGKPVIASWFTDSIVHWGHLRRALREQKRRGTQPGPDLSGGIAAAMMNHPAAGDIQLGKHITGPMVAIGSKIGFVPLKDMGSWARLISFRQPLESLLGKYPAMLLAALADLFIPKIPKPTLEAINLEGDFDSRFDALWEKAKQEYPAITRRDSAVLNWRYRRHPDTSYTVLAIEDKDSLIGYLVYTLFFRHGQRRAMIVDALAQQGNAEALGSLIATALRQMRQEGVHKVECYSGGTMLTAELKRCGFSLRIKKGKDHPTMVRRLPEVDLYITRGDGDGG